MRKWKILAAAAVMAMTAGAIGFTLSPASAHSDGAYSTKFVDGAGFDWDDFGDHYKEIGNSLCNGCANSWNTDTVFMWQSILFAEGLLTLSDLDGKFGPKTASATKKWQSRHGLTADGKVGPATWDAADNHLTPTKDGKKTRYQGKNIGWVEFRRGVGVTGSGAYDMLRISNRVHIRTVVGGHHIYHKKRTLRYV